LCVYCHSLKGGLFTIIKDAHTVYYNAATESAVRRLDDLAAQNRRIIEKLNPPTPNAIVWSVTEGRWINNPELIAA